MTATRTTGATNPTIGTSGWPHLTDDHSEDETHGTHVVGHPLAIDHHEHETQTSNVDGDLLPISQAAHAAHFRDADGEHFSDPKGGGEMNDDAWDGWRDLRIAAELFRDAMDFRIAQENRINHAPIMIDHRVAAIGAIRKAEAMCKATMVATYEEVTPMKVREWVEHTPGLGAPSMARLLGHLGHPRRATPAHWEGSGTKRVLIPDPPYERTIGQLWQYCGHGDPRRSRPGKGATAEEVFACGSPTLKMIVHLIAANTMRSKDGQDGMYRKIYDSERDRFADRVHASPCVRCGPSGRPAAEDTPWKPGHQMAAALRRVGKEILRDLWILAGDTY